jgi:hypothetical protein
MWTGPENRLVALCAGDLTPAIGFLVASGRGLAVGEDWVRWKPWLPCAVIVRALFPGVVPLTLKAVRNASLNNTSLCRGPRVYWRSSLFRGPNR